jgi:hypothetical protein
MLAQDGPQFDRRRSGSLFDRGAEDSCHGRPFNPHWYPGGSYNCQAVTDLTAEERAEYAKGYMSYTGYLELYND